MVHFLGGARLGGQERKKLAHAFSLLNPVL